MPQHERTEMHVIQVAPRFPPAIGGVEEHVYWISKELCRRGHRVTVVTSDEADGKQIPSRIENVDGVQVCRFPLFMPSVFREFWFIPKISSVLGKARPDIVHSHGYRCLSSIQAVYLAHLKGIPSVLTPHGIYPARSFINGLTKTAFDKSAGRLLLDFSDKIVALSKHNRQLLSLMGAAGEKIVTVPNGVNVEDYVNPQRSNKILKQLNTDGPILLYVGRIDWNKQVDKIVEAMPTILKEFPSSKLVVVGPDYANCVKGLHEISEKLKVEHSLVITHDVPRQTLLEYYSVANVFILPSSYEGFGLSMLEAMCSRIPVIVSPSGGPGDILKDRTDALFLKEVSSAEISRQVHTVLTDHQLKETIVNNAFELVKTKYTWKNVVNQLETTYEQAIMGETTRR